MKVCDTNWQLAHECILKIQLMAGNMKCYLSLTAFMYMLQLNLI